MQELIKIEVNEQQEIVVSARELHKTLEVKTKYNDWFSRMAEYGFVENQDFIAIAQKRVTAQGNETTYTDHAIKLDMAKEIAMIQRNEKGKEVRCYFIQVEKSWNDPKRVLERASRTLEFELEQLGIASKKLQLSKVEKITCAVGLLEKYNSPIAEHLARLLPNTQKFTSRTVNTTSATEFIEISPPDGEIVECYWEKYNSYCRKAGESALGKNEFGSVVKGKGYENKPRYIKSLKETKRVWERGY